MVSLSVIKRSIGVDERDTLLSERVRLSVTSDVRIPDNVHRLLHTIRRPLSRAIRLLSEPAVGVAAGDEGRPCFGHQVGEREEGGGFSGEWVGGRGGVADAESVVEDECDF